MCDICGIANYGCVRPEEKALVDSLVMSPEFVEDQGLPPGSEIIWNLSAAKTILEVALRNLINGATASQFSNCKRARDILNETLHLL